MHELSMCEGIRGIIQDQALTHSFGRVTVVRLEIGRFAGVEKAALAFAFDQAMMGSVAEGARLEMIDLPGRALCYGCGAAVQIMDRFDPCPACGSDRLMPQGGDDLRIRNLEVI